VCFAVVVAAASLPARAAAAPPANDNFADATTISTFPATLSGTTVDATAEAGEPNHSGEGTGPGASLWWRWTPSETRHVTLSNSVPGPFYFEVMAVYTGDSLATLDEVASSFNISAGRGLSFWVDAGETYSIVIAKGTIGPDPTTRGPFDVSLDAFNGPDDFAFAQSLPNPPLPVFGFGSNVFASKESGEPLHAGEPGGRSVWWQWTAQTTATVTVHTCSTIFDTLLGIYTGTSVAGLTEVASNDDAPNDLCGTASATAFRAQAGQTYSIAVDGFNGASGNVQLSLEPPPANDDFVNATSISGNIGQTNGTNMFAGWEPGEPLHAGFPGAHSVWWRWSALGDGTVVIWTCGSDFDTVLAVYTGTSVDKLANVASNDDYCGVRSRVKFAARAGTEYRIAVDGTDAGVMGPITLDFSYFAAPARSAPSTPPPAPPPDITAPALRLSGAASQKVLRQRGVFVVAASPTEASSVTAKGKVVVLRSAKVLKLTSLTKQIQKGARSTLKLKLKTSALDAIRRALKAGKKAKATVTVTAKDAAGNVTAKRRTISLRR